VWARSLEGKHQKNFAFKNYSETTNVWSDDFKFASAVVDHPVPC